MSRRRLLAIVIGGAVLLVGAFVGVVLATSGSSSEELVLYSARSHYGEEEPFERYAEETGADLTIRGGSASELYERLRSEGSNTPADVLITVDAANLWRAQEAGIIGSDVDVLNAIVDGDCDVGLTNSYYLGRELEEDPDFPVAPVWADQHGRGTHVNLSGFGVVRGTDERGAAVELLEFLARPSEQAVFARNNKEFPVDPEVKASPVIERLGDFKRDPIDVAGAGSHVDDAVRLMNEVGWK